MNNTVDLVGGPFAVVESDPGAFTILLRKLGVQGLEVVEIYDIESWATEHLDIRGLIFCYPCTDDQSEAKPDYLDFPDPDAEAVWYAHQLSNDACASQAILNVVLNLDDVKLSHELNEFHNDTKQMDPLMKGLSVTNCGFIREAHNSIARPADVRGAMHALATSSLEFSKSLKTAARTTGPPTKRRKQAPASPKKSKPQAASGAQEDTFHYIGFVPAHGKVWQLDGLRAAGPLEVGELPEADGPAARRQWMDIVRPAIKMKMQQVQKNATDQLRYNLLAIVEDRYEKASDALEMLKRERNQLERRLNEEFPGGWHNKVDSALLEQARTVFETSLQSSALGQTFAQDFASRKLTQDMKILDLSPPALPDAWEECVRAAIPAKAAVEEEISTTKRGYADHLSRTFDYELFLQTLITCQQNQGLLDSVLKSK